MEKTDYRIGRLCRVKPAGDQDIDRFLGYVCRVVRVERLYPRLTGADRVIETLTLVDAGGILPGECSVLADSEVVWEEDSPCTT